MFLNLLVKKFKHILNDDLPIYNDKQFYDKFIKNVTLKDIHNFSKELFKKNNSYICIIGNKKIQKYMVVNSVKKLN